jgi:hypothetical protein
MTILQPQGATSSDKVWSDEEKSEWLAAQNGQPTHVVTFEPLYQVEMCIPPWEQPNRRIARSAVTWGMLMRKVFHDESFESTDVVSAHHEGNSLEVSAAVPPPRLRAVT